MIAKLSDYVGHRGELICDLLLTTLCNEGFPILKAQFLGEKFETLDFIVTLEGVEGITPFFFVQVKSTNGGYTKKGKRLKVEVSREEMKKLRAYPVPTYIVGIDIAASTGYIISASASRDERVFSLSAQFALDDCDTLWMLWNEVKAFWEGYDKDRQTSMFCEP